MAQYTALGPDELAALAATFGIGPIASCRALWAGTINSNFRLETARGTLFLRVNEGKREDEVAYEAELVSHLAARGVPTPMPIAAADGRPYGELSGKLLTLFPWVGGHPPDPPRPEDARAVGAALARLHLAGEGFGRRRESRYAHEHIVARAAAIDAPIPELPDVREELARVAAAPPLPRGIIHGDLFPDNVLVDGDALWLLDFEQASDGTFVYDLAVLLLSWCWIGGAFDRELCAAMHAGYVAVRPLSAAEEEGLMVQARFAACRFTVTRLTDIELNPRAGAELRQAKDYREFYARLQALRGLTRLW